MITLYLLCQKEDVSNKISALLQDLQKKTTFEIKFINRQDNPPSKKDKNISRLLIYEKDYNEIKQQKKLEDFKKSFSKIALLSEEQNPLAMAQIALEPLYDLILVHKKEENLVYQIQKLLKQTQKEVFPKLDFFAEQSMESVRIKLRKIMASKLRCVLVTGESGTGKELVANCLENDLDNDIPFFRLNCASLSNELLESELFGHTKGAFTGAEKKKEGLLKQANHGWVFLDEIACLPQKAQSSLLRFLETGEIRPVGEAKSLTLNVRILAATNEPLQDLITKGLFRKDLLERLRNYELTLAPFRERSREEQESILDHLIKTVALENLEKNFLLSEELRFVLLSYHWRDGNMREIKNTLTSLLINKEGKYVGLCDLPKSFLKRVLENSSKYSFLRNKKNPEKVQEDNLQSLKNTWFIKQLNTIAEKESGRRLNKAKLAKHLQISSWKVSNSLKELQEKELLPEEFFYLL